MSALRELKEMDLSKNVSKCRCGIYIYILVT